MKNEDRQRGRFHGCLPQDVNKHSGAAENICVHTTGCPARVSNPPRMASFAPNQNTFYFGGGSGRENWYGWTDCLYCLPLNIPVDVTIGREGSFRLASWSIHNYVKWLCSEKYRDLKQIQWKTVLSLTYGCRDMGMRNGACVLILPDHTYIALMFSVLAYIN